MAGYLGDKRNMIVHHLAVMKPECKIRDVKKEDRHYFIPDNLEQATKEKFISCEHCITKSL